MRSRNVFALCAFLISIASVSASPASVEVFPDDSTVLANNYTSFEVTVSNDGPVDDVYSISTSAPGEATVAPSRVPESGTLSPGESETVQVWFNPDVDRDGGEYDLRVDAESKASEEVYSGTASVEIIKQHGIEADLESPGAVCRGEEAIYNLDLENTGTQPERFRISASPGTPEKGAVELDAGESTTVEIMRSSATALEDRSYNIEVSSASSYASSTVSGVFVAESCYESEASAVTEEPQVPALTDSDVAFNLENTGTREDTFNLSATGGTVQSSSVTLSPGETEDVRVEFQPSETGSRTVGLTAEGRSLSSSEVDVEVFNGQNASVAFGDGPTELCEDSSYERRLEVENNGAARETYRLETTLGDPDVSNFTLEPGETRRIDVDLNTSGMEDSERTLSATATAQRLDSPAVETSQTLQVANCYDLEMDVEPASRNAEGEKSVLYRINLSNTGDRFNSYRISTEGPEWVSVRPSEVFLEAGESGSSYIYAGIPYNKTSGEFRITATADGEGDISRSETVSLGFGETDGGDESNTTSSGGSFSLDGVSGDLSTLLVSLLVAVSLAGVILLREK